MITQFINTARPIALYLLILISGGYAGLHFTSMMNPSIFGIINANGDLMNYVDWAKSWQITDGFMRVRMGVFGANYSIWLFHYAVAFYSSVAERVVLAYIDCFCFVW